MCITSKLIYSFFNVKEGINVHLRFLKGLFYFCFGERQIIIQNSILSILYVLNLV